MERARRRTYLFRMLKIAQLRKSKRMGQEALADAIGMSQPNISDIERGKHNPTLDTLVKIAAALKVEARDLFEDPDPDGIKSRLGRAIAGLNEDEAEKLLQVAELMAAKNAH